VTITIVYDNMVYDPSLVAQWGFSAWIEIAGHTMLFDTGGDGPTLLGNMEALDLDPQEIEVVVLSHEHGDHTGGLLDLLDAGIQPPVYVPASFAPSFKSPVGQHTSLVEVREAIEVLPGVHSTGVLGGAIHEQGLVIETQQGPVVVTGCAHPGIVNMVRAAGRVAPGDIALVVGGFHLGNASPSQVERIAGELAGLGVQQVSPTHCTGEQAIAIFAEAYGDGYLQGGVGRVLTVGPATAGQDPSGGWPISTPEEQGFDSELLADMLAEILAQAPAIDSVTILRHGHLVADAVVYPFEPASPHFVHSCTKSVVSALVGIAIEQGHLQGVHQPLLELFPGRQVAHMDANKEAITLEHLLTMTTGLDCRDSYLYRWQGLDEMARSDDWVQFVLDLPMAQAPGTEFEYCNGASFLLSAAIQEATGQSALAFAEEHLFGPLGIHDVRWPDNPQGISIGWGQLWMQPHDMAKIGALYLNRGRWNGRQVVPDAWVEASTRKHTPATLQDGYGYQWWISDAGYYMALGYAGQFIFVLPEQDMVVAFTSDLAEEDFYLPQELLTAFILPAVSPDSPLPANPAGVERLQSLVEALGKPREGAFRGGGFVRE
jgi:metal-dependent hydrolase (beta-lactamase superfamily II)/CubicO group peptidase (beta-lactamase class C family)